MGNLSLVFYSKEECVVEDSEGEYGESGSEDDEEEEYEDENRAIVYHLFFGFDHTYNGTRKLYKVPGVTRANKEARLAYLSIFKNSLPASKGIFRFEDSTIVRIENFQTMVLFVQKPEFLSLVPHGFTTIKHLFLPITAVWPFNTGEDAKWSGKVSKFLCDMLGLKHLTLDAVSKYQEYGEPGRGHDSKLNFGTHFFLMQMSHKRCLFFPSSGNN
jgi:hypothetical protein